MLNVLQSKFFRDTTWYIAGNAAPAAVALGLSAFLSHHFTPADFGVIAVFTAALNILRSLILWGTTSILSKRYVMVDATQLRRNIQAIFGLLLVLGVGATFAAVVFVAVFPGLAVSLDPLWLLLAGALGLVLVFCDVIFVLLKMEMRSKQYFVLRLSQGMADGLLVVSLVLVGAGSWQMRLWSLAASHTLVLALGLLVLSQLGLLVWPRRNEYTKDYLQKGAPLVPYVFSSWILTSSDQIFVARLTGLEAAGIYAIAYQIAMVMTLLQNSFNDAWMAWFMREAQQGTQSAKLRIARATWAYGAVMFALAGAAYVGGWVMLRFIYDARYAAAATIIGWVAVGYAFDGIRKMAGNHLFFLERTSVLGLIATCFAALNLLLNYVLISNFGALGGAYATALTFALQAIVTVVVAQRLHPMPYLASIGRSKGGNS